jgi:hypothetical protein
MLVFVNAKLGLALHGSSPDFGPLGTKLTTLFASKENDKVT